MQILLRFVIIMVLSTLCACGNSSTDETPTRSHTVEIKLTSSDGADLTNPTNDEIRDALAELHLSPECDAFAIIGKDNMTYVQVGGDQRNGFDVEYRLGSAQKHYRADRTDYSLDEIVKLFAEFRDGDVDWNAHGKWSKLSF